MPDRSSCPSAAVGGDGDHAERGDSNMPNPKYCAVTIENDEDDAAFRAVTSVVAFGVTLLSIASIGRADTTPVSTSTWVSFNAHVTMRASFASTSITEWFPLGTCRRTSRGKLSSRSSTLKAGSRCCPATCQIECCNRRSGGHIARSAIMSEIERRAAAVQNAA